MKTERFVANIRYWDVVIGNHGVVGNILSNVKACT